MADEELQTVTLRNDFYRDGFKQVMILLLMIGIALFTLITLSIYLYLSKPNPIVFKTDVEWRIKPDVSLEQPYLSTPDLLQWVTSVITSVFVFDFNHYKEQLNNDSQYFTADGWRVFLNQLNVYANYNNVQTNKLFVTGSPAGAPFVLNQGLYAGKWAWWVQIPVNIKYAGYKPLLNKTLTLQLMVVRVSTLNNLNGVGINNVIVANTASTGSVF